MLQQLRLSEEDVPWAERTQLDGGATREARVQLARERRARAGGDQIALAHLVVNAMQTWQQHL